VEELVSFLEVSSDKKGSSNNLGPEAMPVSHKKETDTVHTAWPFEEPKSMKKEHGGKEQQTKRTDPTPHRESYSLGTPTSKAAAQSTPVSLTIKLPSFCIKCSRGERCYLHKYVPQTEAQQPEREQEKETTRPQIKRLQLQTSDQYLEPLRLSEGWMRHVVQGEREAEEHAQDSSPTLKRANKAYSEGFKVRQEERRRLASNQQHEVAKKDDQQYFKTPGHGRPQLFSRPTQYPQEDFLHEEHGPIKSNKTHPTGRSLEQGGKEAPLNYAWDKHQGDGRELGQDHSLTPQRQRDANTLQEEEGQEAQRTSFGSGGNSRNQWMPPKRPLTLPVYDGEEVTITAVEWFRQWSSAVDAEGVDMETALKYWLKPCLIGKALLWHNFNVSQKVNKTNEEEFRIELMRTFAPFYMETLRSNWEACSQGDTEPVIEFISRAAAYIDELCPEMSDQEKVNLVVKKLNFHYKWAMRGAFCKNLVQLMEQGRNLQHAWTECQNNKMAPIQLRVAEPALANQQRPERFSQYGNKMRSRQEHKQTAPPSQQRRDVQFAQQDNKPSSGGSSPAGSRPTSPGRERSRSPGGTSYKQQQPIPANRQPGCCDSCGKAGHYAKFCPERLQKVADEAARTAQQALVAAQQALLKAAQGPPKN
jgi:hypothetical protein